MIMSALKKRAGLRVASKKAMTKFLTRSSPRKLVTE